MGPPVKPYLMNIFLVLLLIFCFLNPFDASDGQVSLKRKLSKFSSNEGDTVQESSEAIASFKRVRNNYANILKLPNILISLIGAYLDNPYKTLPYVSYDIWVAMREFAPGALLADRSSNPNLRMMSPSPEMARLFALGNRFLNEDFHKIFTPGSVFKPTSPETIEYLVLFIQNTFVEAFTAFNILVAYLKTERLYQSLIKLLKLVPLLTFDFESSDEIIDCILNILNHNPDDLVILKRSLFRKISFYVALCALPIPLETFQLYTIEETATISPSLLLSAVAISCSVDVPMQLSEEQKKFIHQRNAQIIESTVCEHPQINSWAGICNDLSYTVQPDEPIDSEIVNVLTHRMELIQTWRSKLTIQVYLETLINIAIRGGYKNIFSQMMKLNRYSIKSSEIRDNLKKHPELVQMLSPNVVKKIFGVKDQVFLFENQIIQKQDIPFIANIYELVRVLYRTTTDLRQFRVNLIGFFNIRPFSISQLITKMSNSSDNPAQIINQILITFKDFDFEQAEQVKIARALGEPKHIESLLKVENGEFLKLPSEQFYVIVDGGNFREIFNMTAELRVARLKEFRKLFLIKWNSVFTKNHLHPDEIVKLFDIFGVEIGNFEIGNFDIENEDVTRRIQGKELILKDSRVLFRNPEIFSEFVGNFLFTLGSRIFYDELYKNEEFYRDRSNPFVLKSYGIFKLWMDRNLETFLGYAPKFVLVAFISKLNPDVTKNMLLNPMENKSMIHKLWSSIFSPMSVTELSIDNTTDLLKFFDEALPYLFNHFVQIIHLDVRIHWDKIVIESSGNIFGYEVILLFINKEEIETLKQTNPMKPEISYFLAYVNSEPRRFPK